MFLLGISAMEHDPAAALMHDGKIVAPIEEGKLARTRTLEGIFLNPLLVAAVERNSGFTEIFVQPAAGNEGTSLGATWISWHRELKNQRMEPAASPYWGPSFSNEEIKEVLDNCKASYRWCDSEDRKIEEALKLFQAGKIVAWFQGAAEFGPRAFGNRSLLASHGLPT